MDISVFVRNPNAIQYDKLGKRSFGAIPRADEYVSLEWNKELHHFQVVAVHHSAEDGGIELYAVRADPPWEIRQNRAIGFGSGSR